MRYKRRNPGEDPRVSEPDIYVIDPNTGQRRPMSGVEAANYAVSLQRLMAEDPINYDKERTRASITWHINHAMRMGYPWDELKVRLSKAKKGERSNPRGRRRNPGVPAQRAGKSALTGEVFRVTSYGSGGEIELLPNEADRKDFKREGEARRYARTMATKYGAAVPIIRYLFSKSGSLLHREHWTSEYPARKKNPRRRGNPIFSPGEQLVWEKTDPERASYRLHNVTVVERLPDHWGEEVYKVKMGRRFAEVYGSELQRK